MSRRSTPRVFIPYRREQNRDAAGRPYDRLTAELKRGVRLVSVLLESADMPGIADLPDDPDADVGEQKCGGPWLHERKPAYSVLAAWRFPRRSSGNAARSTRGAPTFVLSRPFHHKIMFVDSTRGS